MFFQRIIKKYLQKLNKIVYGTYQNKYYQENYADHFKYDRVVVFDTETTGLDTAKDDIIQIAAIEKIKGQAGKSIMMYFATDKKLSPTQTIHNISNEHLKNKAIDKKEGLLKFLDFIQNDPLQAHNIKFDNAILNSNLKKVDIVPLYRNKLFCSLYLCRQLYPKLNSYKLGNILKALKLEGDNSHDALDDTKATANLAFKLYEKICSKQQGNNNDR